MATKHGPPDSLRVALELKLANTSQLGDGQSNGVLSVDSYVLARNSEGAKYCSVGCSSPFAAFGSVVSTDDVELLRWKFNSFMAAYPYETYE